MPVPTVHRPPPTAAARPAPTIAPTRGRSPLVAAGAGQPMPLWIGETGGFVELASDQIDNADALLATRWTHESRFGNSTVRKLGGFFANAPAGNARLSLWTSTGTLPGTQLAVTPSFAPVNGRDSRDVVTPVSIAPGEYWLCAHLSANALGLATHGTTTALKSRFVAGVAYGSPPTTWPGGSSSQQLSRYVWAELTSDSVLKPSATSPPGSPPTLSGPSGKSLAGYALTFDDEFDFYDRTKWQSHIFWNYESPPDSIYTQDSILHIDSRSSDGYPDVYLDTLGILDNVRYGYFECRMKWTHGKAAWPAFWLFSSDWSKEKGCGVNAAGELDVMEAWGPSPNINETTSINSFAGTIHNDSANVCSENVVGPTGGENYRDLSPTVLGGQWHNYGMLWEPTKVTWYLDQAETHSVTVGPASAWPNLDQDMHVILYSWPESSEFGHPGVAADGTSPDPLDVQVDWVRVWQD